MTKPKTGKRKTIPKGPNVLTVAAKDGEERDVMIARIALGPGARHAAIGNTFSAQLFGDSHAIPIERGAAVIGEAMAKARKGDKAMASDLLAAQAVTLDTMFTELARRSAANMGNHIGAMDRYMRLALKAQSNCRATLDALAKLHQPREQTVKHVHVNQGGQAVIADQVHNHAGGRENGKFNGQPHATESGAAGTSSALLGHDSQGHGLPIPGGEGKQAVQDARRQGQRRA